MNRCLNERALLGIYMRDSVAAQRSHLRLCADCAERFELLREDLEMIGRALDAPPLGADIRRVSPSRARWMPVAAAACTALLVLVIAVTWLRPPAPVRVVARPSSVSAFADDLSAALFATADANTPSPLATDAPYVEAALRAGEPCTRARFFTGECNDQVSAFVVDVSDLEETVR